MSNTSPMSNTRRLLLLLVPLVALLGVIATSSAAGAAATDGTTVTRHDVTGSTAVCNDTVLTVTSGVLQIATHQTLTPNGAIHVSMDITAQGVHAVAPTGAAYQLAGGLHIEVNVTPGATTQTETDIFNAIGQGSAPNFTIRGVVHTTVDANGNVTASVDNLTVIGNCIP